MNISKKEIGKFQEKILTWYAENKRNLPWREVPVGTSLQQHAYRVLVSEIMSQQTQISRVIPKFEAWMKKFPNVQSLAAAKVSDVLHYWSGLGYNRRALNLKKTAEILDKEYHGKFPNTEKELLELPGIGKYTARAILCFAFNQQVAVVDTNVRRVIFTQVKSSKLKVQSLKEKNLYGIAEQLLPKGRAYEWNQALMDYAGAMLKKEKIPITRQSKFIGSHRYYRGRVLKILLAKKKVSVAEIGYLIKKDYNQSQKEWVEGLIRELKNEGFITQKDDFIFLKE